jgi:hypothetical protein
MTLGQFGLILDIVGVVLVGYVAPKLAVLVADTAAPRPRTGFGRVVVHVGWAMILLGFVCQLVGSYVHPSP